MGGENFPDGYSVEDIERIRDSLELLRKIVGMGGRVILVNKRGFPLSDDEKRELNVRLGRDTEMGIGDDASRIDWNNTTII